MVGARVSRPKRVFQKLGERITLVGEPPFSLLDEVVEKIRNDGAKAVLIMPQWEGHRFFEEVQPMIFRKHIYPKGTRVFDHKEGPLQR